MTRRVVDRREIELGDEPLPMRRRARAGVVISVLLSAEEADQLQNLAEALGKPVTQLASEVIREFLRSDRLAPAGSANVSE